MAGRNKKGQFMKGGHTKTRTRARRAAPLVIQERVTVAPRRRKSIARAAHHAVASSRRRRKHITPPVAAGHIVVSALALGAVAGTNNTPIIGGAVYDIVQKVPGAKTFGGAAVAGAAIGGIGWAFKVRGKWRTWMNAAGFVGLAAAGVKLGVEQTSIKWLGDVPSGPSPAIRDITGR